MFEPITIPFGAKMLFNFVSLKDGVSFEDAELALGEMCNTVKNTYGDKNGGFIAGQVFEYAGFISEEGSVGYSDEVDEHLAIVTYWNSFDQHELSHADEVFKDKFSELVDMADETFEIGYNMLWQGEP